MTDPTNPSKFSKLLEAANQVKPSSQPAPKRDLKSLYLTGQESTPSPAPTPSISTPPPTSAPVFQSPATPKAPAAPYVTGIFRDEINTAPKIEMPGPGASVSDFRPQKSIAGLPQEQPSYSYKGMPFTQKDAMAQIYKAQKPADLEGLQVSNDPIAMKGLQKRMDSFNQPKTESKPQNEVNPFMSYLNIFSSRIANTPADLGEGWAIASAAIERGLGKLGVPGANKNLKATDIATYKGSENWRKFMDEVYPVNKPDRETFLGGVMDGLGQVVPLALTGGTSAMPKVALQTTKAGTNVTPFINTGKEIVKRFASKEGVLAGSQIAAPSYKQAKEQGASEDEALRFAIENYAVGSVVENLPIQSMFSRIAKLEPKAPILNIVKEGVVGGGEDAVTEMWQATYENWSANRIYNANREIFDGIGEAGSIGGAVGFILNAATTALIGKRARTSNPQERETLTKAITELEQKQRQVEQNNDQLAKNVKALELSSLMGEGLGPKSFGSTKPSNVERRNQAGKVVLAKDKNGKTIEITGVSKPQEDGSMQYTAITPGGKFFKVNENDITDVTDVDLDTFNQVLEGKFENTIDQETEVNTQVTNQAASAIDQFRAEFQPFAIPTPMGEVVGLAQLDGQDVFVLQDQPNGNVLVQSPGQPRQIVAKNRLQGSQFLPFDQFVSQFGPVPQEAVAPFDPSNPVQAGEEVEIEGQNYVVTGVNYDTNQVALELQDGDNVDVLDIPLEAFQSYRKPAETTPSEPTAPQAPTPAAEAPKSGAAKLRELFPTEEQKKQQEELRSQERPDETLKPINEIDPNEPATSATESPSLPAQPASQEQAGVGQPTPEDAPAQPVSEGVDSQVQVEDEITLEQQFELAPAQNTQDIDSNLNKVLSQYSGRAMGKVQAFRYLTELGDLGKQWAQEKGITSKEELDKWVEKAQSKARSGKGLEKKQAREAVQADNTKRNVDEIEQIALQAAQDFENLINQPQPQNEVQQPQQTGQAGQEDVQAPQNQENRPQEGEGQKRLEGPVLNQPKKPEPKKKPRKKTPEQLRKQEILDREPTTARGFARQWLLNGGKLNSTQSAENRQKGVGIGKGVRDETGMSGREMRSLIGIIDNKNGLSPEVAAEQIHETMNTEMADRISVQDLRNALIDVLLTEDRKQWYDLQDAETKENFMNEYDRWVMDQLTPEEIAEFDARQQEESYWEYISENIDELAKQWDEFEQSEAYQQYIEEVYGQIEESGTDGQDQSDEGDFSQTEQQEALFGTDGDGAQASGQQQGSDSPDASDTGKPQSERGTGTGNDSGKPFLNLNPSGNFTQALNAGRETLTQDQLSELEANGRFLDQIMGDYPQLTQVHENEIFDLINSGADRKKIAQIVANKANTIDFDASKPLNLSKQAEASPVTKRGEIERKIKEIQARTKKIQDLAKKRPLSVLEKAEIAAMTKEVNRLQQQYDQAQSKQEATKPVEQGDLFAGGQKASEMVGTPAKNQLSKSDQLSAEAQKKADELKNLFDDFFDAGKGKLQSGPINAEQIVIAGKIIGKASELGIVKFKQLIEWANQNIGTDKMRQYFDSFKAAFGANLMINNPEGENINEIAASKFEDYLVVDKQKEEEVKPEGKTATINGSKGDINKDGFFAYNSNYSANQDAVYADKNLFIVSDGMGSYKESGLFAKDLVEAISQLEKRTPEAIKKAAEQIAKKYTKAATTLSIVEKTGNPGEFTYYSIGDSPIYIFDKNGAVKERINENIAVATNGFLAFGDGRILTNEQAIKTGKINLEEGETLVVASDGFGDVFARVKEQEQIQGILEGLLEGDEKFVQEIRDVFKDEKSDDFSVVVVKSDKPTDVRDSVGDQQELNQIRDNAIKEVKLPKAIADFFKQLNSSKFDDHSWAITGSGFVPRQANEVRNFFSYISQISNNNAGKDNFIKILNDMGFDIGAVDLERSDLRRIFFNNGLTITLENGTIKGEENLFKQGTLISVRDTEAYRRMKNPERFNQENKDSSTLNDDSSDAKAKNPMWYENAIEALEKKRDMAKTFPSEQGRRSFWTGFYQNIIDQLPKDFDSAMDELNKSARLAANENTVFEGKKQLLDDFYDLINQIGIDQKTEQFTIPEVLQTNDFIQALNTMYKKQDEAGNNDVNTDDQEAIISQRLKQHGYTAKWGWDQNGKNRLYFIKKESPQNNVPTRSGNSQQDSPISDAVQANQKPFPSGRSDSGNDGEGDRQPGIQAKQPQDRPSSVGISTTVSRKPSNKPVQQQLGIFGTKSEGTGVVDGRGDSIVDSAGNDAGRKGDVPVDKGTKDGIESFADSFKRKIKLQAEAEKIPAKLLDKDNIRETLPVLLDEQQEDVIRAEERFFGEQHKKPEMANGKGYLFTNGTGTGKTFTGLGVAKRFIKQGKGNILLVVPGQPKVADWKDAAEKLGITINPLVNTKDAGKGFVATTYANFTLNQALKDRDWDLIIYDESHLLMAEQKGNESARTISHYKHSGVSEFWALEKLKDATGLWEKQRELLGQMRNINLRINKDDTMKEMFQEGIAERKKLEEELKKVEAEQEKILPSLKERAKKNYENTKVLFLSASPFATVKNLAYANGTLFDWGNETTYEQASRGKSRVDPKSRFFLDNFGAAFEWKNHQLQERSNSNAEAISMQEIAFGNKLAQQGVMSGRAIESNRDYARHFPLVTGFNRDLYNEAVNEIYKGKGKYSSLSPFASKQFFEYENALQLMESMRTSMSLSRIDEHLKLGRKVVIFHKRHKADVSAPFAQIVMEAKLTAQAGLANPQLSTEEKKKLNEMLSQAEAFEQDFAELLKYEQTLDYSSTVDQISKKYRDQAVYFNGNISTKDKIDAIKQFNDDSSKVKIIVVHEQSGREGISLHDTTGKHQRALMSMSLPSQSITTLQVEGRIYRIGQESDAVLEYPILGLDTEIAHFASKINKKVSTTENLAMGDGSRDLLKSFAFGVMNASDEAPSMEQGKGGKELDKREREEHSQFKKARLVYAGNQKVRGTRKDRQGVDFYPTPEPVGQKMVEWLGLKPTQKFLEPSAGKGAIAMWAPGSVKTTAIEPAMDLIGRLGSVIQNGETLQMDFMDHNIVNKYDGIAMNPPFGSAGATAIEHLAKAAKHLRNGGRVVALIPVGSTDKKFDAFMESKDASDLYLRAEVLLPSVTFEKAGTAVNTRIVVIDKVNKPANEADLNIPSRTIDLRNAKTVDELFDRLENISMPDKIEVQGKEQDQAEAEAVQAVDDILNTPLRKPVVVPFTKAGEGDLKQDEFTHTKTGEKIPRVTMEKRFTSEEFQNLKKVAQSNNGYWSGYAKGFLFDSKENAEKFINSFRQSNRNDPKFMRAGDLLNRPSSPTQSKQTAKVQAEANRITGNWKNGPTIEVYPNGAAIEAAFPEVQFRDMDRVPGLFYDGKVILNAAHPFHNQPGGTETIILHESIGHFGMGNVINELSAQQGKDADQEYARIMQDVYDRYQDTELMQYVAKTYFGKDPANLSETEQIEAGEEYIAHTAQTGVKDKWIDGVIAKIREILRKLGFKLQMADAELRAIIGRASRFVVDGPSRMQVEGQIRPSMMIRDTDQTQSPAFKAWFGDSKVVDENGRPKIMYHGTNSEFTEFNISRKGSLGAGIYLTPDKETALKYGKIAIPLYVKIENPKIVNTREEDTQMLGSSLIYRKKKGMPSFDGVIDQYGQMLVLDSTQLKSATGNVGTFDPKNPDIRYTLTPSGSGIRINDFVPADKQTKIQNRLENSPNFLSNPRYMVQPAGVETKSVENQRRKRFLAGAKAFFEGKNPISQEKRTRARENFQDAMLPGRRMIERKAGDLIKDESNFYVKENLAADKVVFQIGQMERKHIAPIKALTDQIQEKHGVTFEQIEDYLGALHNEERRNYLSEKNPDDALKYKDNPKWPTGMTDEEAKQIIKDYESKVPQGDRDKLNGMVKNLVNFSLDTRLEAGLISQAYYDQLKTQYDFYVPLRGWADRIEYDPTKYSPMKEAKGRISKAASPLAYLYADAADAIAHGERNKVFQSMYQFVMEHPDKNEYMVKASYFRKSKKDDGTETWVEMDESEGKPSKEEIKKGTVIRGFNPEIMKDIALAKHGDLTLPVFIKGQKVYILFAKQNEQLVKALKNTAYSKIEGLAKFSSGFTRFLSSAFTEYSPEFGFVNGARDMQMGNFSVILEDGPEMAAATMRKYPKSIKELYAHFWNQDIEKASNPYLKEFMESGAFTGFSQAREVKDIYKMLSNQSLAKKWDETKVARLVSTHNKAIENAYRFAYFQAMREKGYTVQKAASKAKDVTVNFRRRGNMTSSVGAYFAFFNAGVQGIERFTRPFFKAETRNAAAAVAGTLFATGFMQAAMYNLFGAIDEEDDELMYDKIPEFTRSMNIIIPFPNATGYVTVPMGYGLNVPYALGELTANVAAGKKTPGSAMMRALTIISESFSPLGGYEFEPNNQRPSQKAVQFVSPTFSKPIIDLAINSNFFGARIIQEQPWEKGVPNSQLATPSTSKTAIRVSEMINSATGGDDVVPGNIDLNPTALEYLAKQYGGGPLSFGNKVLTTYELLRDGENPLIQDNVRKAPFVSRFYQDANNSGSVLSKYFKNREEVLIALDRYESYLKTNRPDKAEEYYQTNRHLIEMENFLKSYDKGIKSIRKAMEAAELEGDQEEVKQLKKERDNLMKEYNAITKMTRGDKQVRASDLLK